MTTIVVHHEVLVLAQDVMTPWHIQDNHQLPRDVRCARLKDGEDQTLSLAEGRIAWVQIVKGRVVLNGEHLAEGDGAAIQDPDNLTFTKANRAEVLIFDMKA